jgi:anti-sigma regulatory factor (Ser/Thr protein kinase)
MNLLVSRSQTRLLVEDSSHVGECRRAAQRLAQNCDLDETLTGRVGIIATEMANNLVNHAGHGELLIQAIHDGARVLVEIISIDRGPGMQVEQCMRDGYSTGGTAGTGLGAILRLSDLFDVYSIPGQGTVAVARITGPETAGTSRTAGRARELEFGAISIAVAGEIECGDIWRIASRDGSTAILVADGLGHGPLAATAARAAAAAFGERPFDAPTDCMQHLHQALAGSRGAAAACAVLDPGRAKIAYSGVGNISGSVLSAEHSRGMVSHNGVLGSRPLRPRQFEYDYAAGDRVVMHSDGISARWTLSAYPGLFRRHAAVIAAVLYRDYARTRDDATVVVSGMQA